LRVSEREVCYFKKKLGGGAKWGKAFPGGVCEDDKKKCRFG